MSTTLKDPRLYVAAWLKANQVVINERGELTYGGYLSLGRAQWSLTCFKDDKAKNQQWSLSGYYDFNDTCYLEQICEILNIAIVDRRKMSLNKAICLSIHNKTELENFLTKGA